MKELYFILVLICVLQCKAGADIKGSVLACNNEGMQIKLDKSFLCYTCVCKNRLIECQPKSCPKNEDCSNPTTKPNDPCCPSQCKGCWYNGSLYDSGAVISQDSCTTVLCVHGVVTESNVVCHTPCSAPLPPLAGQCCHRCPTCSLRGQSMSAGTELRPTEDPCLKCVCDSQRRMTCSKLACPILNCPVKQRVKPAGQCCQRCIQVIYPTSSTAVRPTLMSPPRGYCLLGNWLMRGSQEHAIDSCTRCTCLQGSSESTVFCKASTCPPLIDCPEKNQRHLKPSDCCKTCPPLQEVSYTSSQCLYKGTTYQDGDSFQMSPCISCQCDKGVMKCARADCSLSPDSQCPRNYKLAKLPGRCCHECIERNGRCMMYGVHFRTFDEKHYSFQGDCKYQLALDCSANHSFAVRMSSVAPSAGARKAAQLSKLITVKVGEHKVTMGQRMKTKVNGVRVTVPYKLNNSLELSMQRENVLLTTHIGLQVVWNGHSLIEISVPPSMKSQLCGLCGNYNGQSGDDFVNRRGEPLHKIDQFAQAWRIGGAKSCPKGVNKPSTDVYVPEKQNRRYRKCSPLRDVFVECHKAVPSKQYHNACMSQTCRRRCHCEVFEAYMRECVAMSANVSRHLTNSWRYITDCYRTS